MTNFLFLLLKQTDFSDWQCQEDCFLKPVNGRRLGKGFELERETEGTARRYVTGNGVPLRLEELW